MELPNDSTGILLENGLSFQKGLLINTSFLKHSYDIVGGE
jgi:hypothetical protein